MLAATLVRVIPPVEMVAKTAIREQFRGPGLRRKDALVLVYSKVRSQNSIASGSLSIATRCSPNFSDQRQFPFNRSDVLSNSLGDLFVGVALELKFNDRLESFIVEYL